MLTPTDAHGAVARAIKRGLLIRPTTCNHCGNPPRGKGTIEAHHEDYAKPLEVLWLCSSCHRYTDEAKRHREGRVFMARTSREARVRRIAKRQRLRLQKSRLRDPRAYGYDRWRVFNEWNAVVAGGDQGLTLEELEHYLTGTPSPITVGPS